MYEVSTAAGSGASLTSAEPDWTTLGGRPDPASDDAALTPIFHALALGGLRSRQHEPAGHAEAPTPAPAGDAVAAFELDPLHAPMPARPAAELAPVRPLRPASRGRHRR